MSSLALVNSLTSVFMVIGVVGAVFAVACAIVAGYALATRADGLCGGAAGLWIAGAMLSLTGSFANTWTMLIVSIVALVAALVIGAVVRGRMPVRQVETAAA